MTWKRWVLVGAVLVALIATGRVVMSVLLAFGAGAQGLAGRQRRRSVARGLDRAARRNEAALDAIRDGQGPAAWGGAREGLARREFRAERRAEIEVAFRDLPPVDDEEAP